MNGEQGRFDWSDGDITITAPSTEPSGEGEEEEPQTKQFSGFGKPTTDITAGAGGVVSRLPSPREADSAQPVTGLPASFLEQPPDTSLK